MIAIWSRLGRIWLRAILPGLALAALLFAAQIGLIPIVGQLTLGFDDDLASAPTFGLLLVGAFAHALFITLLTDILVRRSWHPRGRAVLAALVLTLPISLFAVLDLSGASYGCADGRVTELGSVPLWPWAWIGWLLLATSALPARILGHSAAAIEPWPERIMMLTPFALVILLTGAPFQRRTADCTPPFDGGWGLFEGGMVTIPLLALFFFSMAFSLAVLSAAAVRISAEGSEP
jgi:hypothetical protein